MDPKQGSDNKSCSPSRQQDGNREHHREELSLSVSPKKRKVPADPANRLSDHGYLLTQSDVANVARLIYGLHNTDDSDVFFEVEGSVRQFRRDLESHLPYLVSGHYRTLTFIINLNADHWVTVVVVRHATVANRLVGYYADSFGSRPQRFGRYTDTVSDETNDAMVLSFSAVRATLGCYNVDFEDISVAQQRDFTSCGVFALENAHRINEAISAGNFDPERVQESLATPAPDVYGLRAKYEEALDFNNHDLLSLEDEAKSSPMQVEEKDLETQSEKSAETAAADSVDDEESSINDELNEEEANSSSEEDLNEEEANSSEEEAEDAPIDGNNPYLDDADIDLMKRLFKQSPNMVNLRRMLTAFLTNPHGSNLPIWQDIRQAFDRFESLAFSDPQEQADVFAFVLDVLEEADDFDALRPILIDYNFIEQVTDISQKILGINHLYTIKLWLQRIYYAKDMKEKIVDFINAKINMEHLVALFNETTPPHSTGMFVDANIFEDPLRGARYLFTLALIHRSVKNFKEALNLLSRAIEIGTMAYSNPLFNERRPGDDGAVQLSLQQARSMVEAAELANENDLHMEPLGFIVKAAETLLHHRPVLGLPESFALYLAFVTSHPGYTPNQLETRLATVEEIPLIHLRFMAIATRVRAFVGASSDPLESIDIMNRMLDHFSGRMANVPPEALQETKRILYTMLRERLRIHLSIDNHPKLSVGMIEFFRSMRQMDLEDQADDMMYKMPGKLVQKLHWMSRHPEEERVQAEWMEVLEEIRQHDGRDYFNGLRSNYYESVARMYWNYGRLGPFIVWLLRSRIAFHQHGSESSTSDSEMENLLFSVLDLLRTKLVEKINGTSVETERELLKKLFYFFLRDDGGTLRGFELILKDILVQIEPPSHKAINQPRKVLSLKVTTLNSAFGAEEDLLMLIQSFLDLALVQNIMSEVLADLSKKHKFYHDKQR